MLELPAGFWLTHEEALGVAEWIAFAEGAGRPLTFADRGSVLAARPEALEAVARFAALRLREVAREAPEGLRAYIDGPGAPIDAPTSEALAMLVGDVSTAAAADALGIKSHGFLDLARRRGWGPTRRVGKCCFWSRALVAAELERRRAA